MLAFAREGHDQRSSCCKSRGCCVSDEERLARERLERFVVEDLPALEEAFPNVFRGQLTDEELMEGARTISRNAEELLEDARLLFENGRHARAASLAILALEESFKRLMLFVHPLVREDQQGRKEFWRAWRDHKVKSSTPATAPFLLGQIDEERRVQLTKALGRWANTLKQRGLYADCYEEAHDNTGVPRWALPSQAVDEEEARKAIELAATFAVPLAEEDARWMLACAGSSGNVLEVLLSLADRAEGLSEGEDWGAIGSSPENVRRFVEAVAKSLGEAGTDGPE